MSPKLSTKHRLKVIKRVFSGEKKVKICREEEISRTLLYRWLKRYKKENKFCSLHPQGKAYRSFKKHQKLSTRDRHFMIERVLGGESVSRVCKLYDVSRTTFYRWHKRYSEAKSGQKLEALWDKKPKADKYFNQSPLEFEKAVLSAVKEYPELSSHRLVYVLPEIGKKPILENHGVQNILRRHNLNTYEKRLAYSQSVTRIALFSSVFTFVKKVISQIGEQETPVRQFIVRASFTVFLAVFTGTIFYGATSLWRLVFGPTGVVITTGFLFSLLSLFLGMVFFIYSLKYYLTVAVVLSFSKESDGKDLKQAGKNFWERIFFVAGQRRNYQKKSLSANWQGGLNPDLSKIKLRRHPFVSIHIATYNEKRVIKRLLAAAASMDYENYEVVIVDDSKDETSQIIEDYLKVQSSKFKVQSQEGNKLIIAEIRPGLIIKFIHRQTREGFKGGALKEALKITNPKTEFICIFDADFIPYPDTIVQFLKYFQSTCTSLDKRVLQKTNVACVQGYQWHVLNKSENWITRGVRSEYAGSYVIERSGEEIYSGLKQISGSVYMIRKDVLQNIGWGTSITEDFQLTLKLYEQGYKVVYTPYIQAPAEAVSTIKRLIRQRMRWAEGHSHNVKQMFWRLLAGRWENQLSVFSCRLSDSGQSVFSQSVTDKQITDKPISENRKQKTENRSWVRSPLTLSEKLEFLYLSPYYLQSFLFMVGTFAWFVAEVIFRVQLPFWTEVWGWSLVFTNLLSLPLMNMVGLFLEEAEEKDYMGIFSFVVLSYIVAPFQGYAALKGFLAKEEGPWFRTPKTGRITDIFTPGKFYRKLFGLMQKPQAAFRSQISNIQCPISNIQSNPVLAFASANNTFSSEGIRKIRGKRRGLRFAPKAVIAIFLAITIMLNYMTFFLPKAQAATVGIEQQINIIDQLYSTTSTSTPGVPTDNSLGLIRWTSGSYSDTYTVYFEAVICNTGYFDGKDQQSATTYAGLYDSSGTLVTGSQVSVTANGCSWSRQRSGSITLTNGTDYTARIYSSSALVTGAKIQAARLIITQTNATWITDTETQIEVGNNKTTTSTTDVVLPSAYYYYDSSKFSPSPTVYFEATLSNSTAGQTAIASLYTSGSSCTSQVASSAVTVTGTSWSRVRSAAITLTNDTSYMVCLKAGANTAKIANAKIVFVQSDTANGISALETIQQYINTSHTPTSTAYNWAGFNNEYAPGNFAAGTFTKYHEMTAYNASGAQSTINSYLQNQTDQTIISGGVVTNNTLDSTLRVRSGDITSNMPSATKTLDVKTSYYAFAGTIYNSWLIIQVSALQVPENLLFFIPVVFFLPKIIRKIKSLKRREILVMQLKEV